MKIVADSHIPFVKDYFNEIADLVLIPGRMISERDVKEADVLLVRSITRVNQALLGSSNVKWVGSVTAGKDHLDTAWLDKAGIKWCVADGFNAPAVADYVVSVIAAMQKKQLLTTEKLTAAIIGVGHTGKLVDQQLRALGYETICCDPLRAESEPHFKSTPLEAIESVDVISLHVPLTFAGRYPTHHFIEAAFLSRQKPGTVLINASRGGVVDTAALKEQGKHLHWCLDVWESEPNIDKTLLQRAALATPHIAGYSVQSKRRGVEMVYRKLGSLNTLFVSNGVPSTEMPTQNLSFACEQLTWQDMVLGVFNPILMTEMMVSLLSSANHVGEAFDRLRNDFNYRHEFAYSQVNTDA